MRMAYGDLVKYVCSKYFGATEEHNESNRYIWQNVGTNRVRENLKMPTYWVDRVCDFIKMTEGMYDYIFITDARFPNEIDLMVERFGSDKVTAVRIVRPNFKTNLTETQLTHVSETALDSYSFNKIVSNDGSLKSFEAKANSFIDSL